AGGLGHFVGGLAAGLPITFDCAVEVIEHSGTLIKLQTARGTLACNTVIVTVPTNIIANGGLRFSPSLPDIQQAAAYVPLGVANKIFLYADKADELPESSFVIANHASAASGSYHLRPFGWPVIEGYFGGAYARDLELAGRVSFAHQAIEELCAVLGNAWRQRLKLVAASAWVSDPFSQGSYSHALPGHADQRAVLARPHDGRIFFAGEATSPHSFSTVHGAWESGERAAQQVLALRG
ncbi:MAG: FAD-dependent oxidoreductase, partial [Beijerinckiaceae bacterium]|nr:FAD-dependent oxidoreductase [Beijerinckiaceae bacterium]